MTQEREPLLQQNGGAGNAAAGAKGSPAVLPSLARSVLKFLMWAVFLTWAAGIFFYPTAPVQAAFRRWAAITSTEGLITGLTGTQPRGIPAPSSISPLPLRQGKVGDRSEGVRDY